MLNLRQLIILLPITALAACSSLPTGPSVMVLPGSSKSFEQFRLDDSECRRYAYEQVGGVTPNSAATTSGATSAAVGTGLGAATGAAIAGGKGAAIGAGTGLAAGGLVGANTASRSGYESQFRYDISYIQCMYALGHRVPTAGKFTNEFPPSTGQKSIRTLPAQPGFTPPPPPPGNPPPPPPR